MSERKKADKNIALGCVVILLLLVLAFVVWMISSAIAGRYFARPLLAIVSVICLLLFAANRRKKKTARQYKPDYLQLEHDAHIISSSPPYSVSRFNPAILSFAGTTYYPRTRFTTEQVADMLANNTAVEGNRGGFLLGRSHEAGGIPVIQRQLDGSFQFKFEFEGYEYLINPGVTACFGDKCDFINQYALDKQPIFSEYVPPKNVTIIDARGASHPTDTKYIILDSTDSFYIINKFSTQKNLPELEDLNRQVTYEMWVAYLAKQSQHGKL